MENYNEILNEGLTIKSDRKYWMVRTMGGRYYAEFIRDNFIAVGYNDISLRHLNSLSDDINKAKDELKSIFREKYPNLNNSGYPVSQLLRFHRDIEVGDIVIIPSEGAMHVAIGMVETDLSELPIQPADDGYCPFTKRRRISWNYFGRRSALPPALQLMFNSRHILSDVTSYAPHIDGIVRDFYKKDDVITLVLRIRTRKEVTLDDFCAIQSLEKLVSDFCMIQGIGAGEPVSMKIQMESPGWLKLSSKYASQLLGMSLFVLTLTGGGVHYKDFELYTNGIGGAINEYLDKKADRKLVESAARAIDSLQIKSPDDLKQIIKILETKNQGRRKY